MQHQESSFKYQQLHIIYTQCWLPAGEIKTVLIFVHGLAEHSGRYMNLVNHFVPLGYALYGLDHVGHGKSTGHRAHLEHFTDYIEPLRDFMKMVHDQNPNVAHFMIAHSMGSLIGATYLLDYQADFNGAVLSAPAIKIPDYVSTATIIFGRLLAAVLPKLGVVQLDSAHISRDPAVIEAYDNDPLVFRGKTTARFGSEWLKAVQRVTDEASRIRLPILVLQGSGDQIIVPSCGPTLYESVSSPDKELKIYNGFYHEVFNEPEHKEVMRDVET